MPENIWIKIPSQQVIYRVHHRTLEGGCSAEHGPVLKNCAAFNIQKYPVTNAEFVKFVEQTGYHSGGNFLKHLFDRSDCLSDAVKGIENQPVVFVSLDDAKAYADHVGAKLPTELQWYTAAGGADGRIWPWGDTYYSTHANSDSTRLCDVDSHPLGTSSYGVMDMIGNCFEWTRDLLRDDMHISAILRGGSFYRAPHFWHIKGGAHPIDSHVKMPLLSGNLNRAATVGFRLVQEG